MGCHFLLQGIFLIQGLNPRFLSLLLWHEFFPTWEMPSILGVLVRSKALILTAFAHFSSNVLNILL